MCPSPFHHMTPNLWRRLASYRVAKRMKDSMATIHKLHLEGFSKVVSSYFNKHSNPALTHLLDVPVLSTLRPIPVQGPHWAHQGHDQEDAKQHQDLHISHFLNIRSFERCFRGILYNSIEKWIRVIEQAWG